MKYLLILAALCLVTILAAYYTRSATKAPPQSSVSSSLPQIAPAQSPAVPIIKNPEETSSRAPTTPIIEKLKEISKTAPAVTEWVLKSDLDFQNNTIERKALEPWYVTNVERNWHGGINLAGTQDVEQYLRLNARAPHTVKWELTIQSGWIGGEKGWQFVEDGFYLAKYDARMTNIVREYKVFKIIVEREGAQLRYQVNDKHSITLAIPDTDRAPLMAASGHYDYRILQAKLFFNAGEDFSDALPSPAITLKNPRWEVAYKDDFNEPECVNRYFKLQSGKLVWHEKHKALWLQNANNEGSIYAVVHKSLPGDLRARFRVLRRKSTDQINISVLFNINGALLHEQGYFAEFSNGCAQIKKRDRLQKQTSAPTPATPDRWVALELRRIGAQITLCMEGKTVLEWTDPYPFRSSAHDLFAFYVWSEQTIVDDLIIERNADDIIKPLEDDPATEENILRSQRAKFSEEPTNHDF